MSPVPGLVLGATALLLAGCIAAPAPEAAQVPDSLAAPAPAAGAALRTEPFAWDGSVSPGLCLPTQPGGCSGQRQSRDTHVHALEAPWPTAAVLDLRWDAEPGMEALQFLIALQSACGSGCTQWDYLAVVDGPSPLHLELTGIAVGEEETLVVMVGTASRTPSPAITYVNLDQPFHVEGTLTYEA